jgi:hypothetical protein
MFGVLNPAVRVAKSYAAAADELPSCALPGSNGSWSARTSSMHRWIASTSASPISRYAHAFHAAAPGSTFGALWYPYSRAMSRLKMRIPTALEVARLAAYGSR